MHNRNASVVGEMHATTRREREVALVGEVTA